MALSTVNFKKIETDQNGVWYELNGEDYGTGISFSNSAFCVTPDNVILDSDGSGVTEGDAETIAVRNTLDI